MWLYFTKNRRKFTSAQSITKSYRRARLQSVRATYTYIRMHTTLLWIRAHAYTCTQWNSTSNSNRVLCIGYNDTNKYTRSPMRLGNRKATAYMSRSQLLHVYACVIHTSRDGKEREHRIWPNMKWWRQKRILHVFLLALIFLSYIFIAIYSLFAKNFWIALFEKVMCVIMQLE